MRVIAHMWQGPIALAVYIPAPQQSQAGADCRETVLRYLHSTSAKLPLAVSLVFSSVVMPTLSCGLQLDSTGAEEMPVDMSLFQSHFSGLPWSQLWLVEYPVNVMRSVSRDMVSCRPLFYRCSRMPSQIHSCLVWGPCAIKVRMIEAVGVAWSAGET